MGWGGRVCCSRLALGRQSQSRTRVKRPVQAIYIMYTRVISPLAGSILAGPRRLGQGAGAPEGKGRLSNTFLVLGEGRKCRWRLQIQNVERILK